MVDYLAIKSSLKKHNLHYFTFSQNSKKIKYNEAYSNHKTHSICKYSIYIQSPPD
jgi:hypothetical protein